GAPQHLRGAAGNRAATIGTRWKHDLFEHGLGRGGPEIDGHRRNLLCACERSAVYAQLALRPDMWPPHDDVPPSRRAHLPEPRRMAIALRRSAYAVIWVPETACNARALAGRLGAAQQRDCRADRDERRY